MTLVSKHKEYLLLVATILASGMAFLDSTIVNIALPDIQNDFNATFDQMLWIVNAFALTLASLLLISGLLSDKLGHKKIFLFGIIIFGIASMACAWAANPFQLSLARAFQGVGGALMIPGSLAIINLCIPQERRGRAIGIWSGFSGGIAAAGPFVGGVLVENFSWPAVFYLNIPLAILAYLLAMYAIPETKSTNGKKLDYLGAFILIVGLSSLSHGLMSAPKLGFWSKDVIVFSIAGILLLILFGRYQLKSKHPLVELALFQTKKVLGANIVTLLIYFALNGLILFSVLNIQQVQEISPGKAGLALMPAVLVITLLSGFGGTLTDKFGARKPLTIGCLILALGNFILLFAGTSANYSTTFLPGLILFGLGMAVLIAPLTESALAVSEDHVGAASGLNNAISRTAALIAVAVLGAVGAGVFKTDLQERIHTTILAPAEKKIIVEQSSKFGGIQIPKYFSQQSTDEAKNTVKKSFVLTFRVITLINILLSLIAASVSWLYIKDDKKLM